MENFINAKTIGEAWIKSLQTVIARGHTVPDDKGLIQEICPLFITITAPAEDDPIVEKFGDTAVLRFMRLNFSDPRPIDGWGYSYAQRLHGFRGEDQLSTVLKKLKASPFSKSATINLLDLRGDQQHTPCLTTLDFKLRGEVLQVHAFFRSQDVGQKMYADALEIFRIGQALETGLHFSIVTLHLSICSAHIYLSDIPLLTTMLQQLSQHT